MKISACTELLFAEGAPEMADRIRLAAVAGFDAVEFWRWTRQDLSAVKAALVETGLPLSAMVAEPMVPLTDPASHDTFLQGLASSVEVARSFGTPTLIAQTGDDLEDRSRSEQRDAIVAVLRRAADLLEGSGVSLAIEPLNTRVDHPGYFLHSTVEGLDIIDAVGRREIRLLYDIYHAAVMEEPVHLLEGRIDRVAHLHLADHPGRGEPGSGALDITARLAWLSSEGFQGYLGLEYKPTGPTRATLPNFNSLRRPKA